MMYTASYTYGYSKPRASTTYTSVYGHAPSIKYPGLISDTVER